MCVSVHECECVCVFLCLSAWMCMCVCVCVCAHARFCFHLLACVCVRFFKPFMFILYGKNIGTKLSKSNSKKTRVKKKLNFIKYYLFVDKCQFILNLFKKNKTVNCFKLYEYSNNHTQITNK